MRASIPPDEELWTDSGLTFSGAVEVDGAAALTAEGGVVVRGSWKAPVLYECGRCLEAVDVAVERPLTLLYAPSGGWEAEDPDVRTIGYQQITLDLEEAIREEVLLEIPRYFLPVEKDGRCTECGDPVERFRSPPEEPESGTDPRWAVLEALQPD